MALKVDAHTDTDTHMQAHIHTHVYANTHTNLPGKSNFKKPGMCLVKLKYL